MLRLLDELAPYRHVIWDLNGTLIDDTDLCIQSVNPMLRERGLPEIDAVVYREKFRFPVMDYYHDLGFRITLQEFEELSHRFHARYHELLPNARLFEGTSELLGLLRGRGQVLSILTAAWHGDLERIVRHFGIHESFDHFYGLQHRQADSKIQRGRELLQKTGFRPEESVLIGDTLHDLEVGQALGLDVLLVTEGHMSEERLRREHPRVIKR